MNEREAREKFEKVLQNKPWISPDWEPYAKCSDEEKEQFVLFCNLIGAFYPKSLGAISVLFERCNPERQFICYEKELGHDPEFVDKLLQPYFRVKKTQEQYMQECVAWDDYRKTMYEAWAKKQREAK